MKNTLCKRTHINYLYYIALIENNSNARPGFNTYAFGIYAYPPLVPLFGTNVVDPVFPQLGPHEF